MKTLKEQFIEAVDFDTFYATANSLVDSSYGMGASKSVMKKYVDTHAQAKEHIYKLFGNKLRVEKEIDVTVNSEEVYNVIGDFKSYLSTNKKFIFARSLVEAINYSEFLTNSLCKDYDFFGTKLPKGMKVSKALTKLLLPEHHHEVTTKHSMLYQTLFTKGKVVLSIDPVDYITMSSNSSGWKSCHRLNGGEYATGPLAYLNDSSSVICYIESRTPCRFSFRGKEYTHSNKTWRQIALVSPELEYSIQERQYPNDNAMNAQAVADLFKELFEKNSGLSYTIENTSVGKLADLHVDYANDSGEENLYYNDILNEMFSNGHVVLPKDRTIRSLRDADESIKPMKGGPGECLDCGDVIESPGAPFCYDCYDRDEDDEW